MTRKLLCGSSHSSAALHSHDMSAYTAQPECVDRWRCVLTVFIVVVLTVCIFVITVQSAGHWLSGAVTTRLTRTVGSGSCVTCSSVRVTHPEILQFFYCFWTCGKKQCCENLENPVEVLRF